MKKLVLLFAALLVAGCGEKSSPEGSKSVSEKPPVEQAVVITYDDGVQLGRDGIVNVYYRDDELEAYSGWAKTMHQGGQLKSLGRLKEGKRIGPWTWWHENGQKSGEGSYKDGKFNGPATEWDDNGQKRLKDMWKDGKPDGPYTEWHENGQKMSEGTYKDGEEVSVKYWNSKGEDVETEEEALK